MERCILDYQQQELIASLNVEDKPQLSLYASIILPGRTLGIIQVNNDLEPKVDKFMTLSPIVF